MDEKRDYKCPDLPVIMKEIDSELTSDQLALLRTLYSEVCSTWRTLLDVRFKLLGLVPFVTVAILVILLPGSSSPTSLEGSAAICISILGLLATIGLGVYEIRNSELYVDLMSRGRRIEAELGIETGIFRGRLKRKRLLIDHRTAMLIIYISAVAGWLFALCILIAVSCGKISI